MVFIADSTATSGSKVGELLGRYIFLVDEKNERNISGEKIERKENKKSPHVEGPMFQTKCDNEGDCMFIITTAYLTSKEVDIFLQ